jgi:pyruvate,water dikinase
VQRELSLPLLKESSSLPADDIEALALDFSRPGCTSSKLVGGKGCQLALLQQLNPMEFSVPKGFCLTVRAFETQTKNSPSVQLVIDELHRTSCTHPEQLQSACLSAVTTFKTTPLCSQVINSTVEHLVKVFGTEYADVPLAVRSSAVGEDGTELSAAGQMETDLGVKGLQQILQAIANCWASQFAFPAVSYRREHGQPIKLQPVL